MLLPVFASSSVLYTCHLDFQASQFFLNFEIGPCFLRLPGALDDSVKERYYFPILHPSTSNCFSGKSLRLLAVPKVEIPILCQTRKNTC